MQGTFDSDLLHSNPIMLELKMIDLVYFIFLSHFYFYFYLFSYFGLRVRVIVTATNITNITVTWKNIEDF